MTDDDVEIRDRLESIEQTLTAGLTAIIALLQQPQQKRALLSSADVDEAIELLRHAARELGYKPPS